MTAHAMVGDREKCIAAGMNDYVAKPVSPGALAEVLERWLPKAEGPCGHLAGGAPSKEPRMPDPRPPLESPAGLDASPSAQRGERDEPAADDPPVWNADALLRRLLGDEELLREIVSEFLDDTAPRLRALGEVVRNGDAGVAGDQCHALKGAAAGVGGEAFRSVAWRMEQAGQEGNPALLEALMPELEREFERLREDMSALLGSAVPFDPPGERSLAKE